LGETPGFPQPDVVANLDQDRLKAFPDDSQDFVIASHVLEHLANPLAMLGEIHRVLRPGALLVLLLPDRHRTFDCDRSPTPLTHLVDEYRADVREVDDAHILDFVIATSHRGQPREPAEVSPEEIDLHRQRSVHVHVWDADEFGEVLTYASDEMDLRWTVVDTMPPDSDGTYRNEFGWLLSKGDQPTTALRRPFWQRAIRRR
jgi:SAM-dependent methyltransferase